MEKQKTNFLQKLFAKNFIVFFIFTALTFVLYWQTLSFNFIHLDDGDYMQKSYGFMKNIANIPAFFTHNQWYPTGEESLYYRPISDVAYMLDIQLCGYQNPGCYHLPNILFHIIFVYILFLFLQKLKIRRGVSFVLSLLFLTHPVNTIVVAWIIGSNDSVLGIFFLLSFIFFISYIKSFSKKDFILHLLFLNVALYAKETALSLFPLYFLYLLLIAREKPFRKKFFVLYSSWTVSLGVWFYLRAIALSPIHHAGAAIVNGDSFRAFIIYFGKSIPFNLQLYSAVPQTSIYLGLIVIVLLVILFFFVQQKRTFIFALSWIALLSFPSTIWTDSTSVPIFLEHRLYLVLIGFLIIIALFLEKLEKEKSVFTAAIICVVVLFFFLTLQRLLYFRDAYAFWSQAEKESPSANTYFGLAYVYQFIENDPQKALFYYQKELTQNPKLQYVRSNMAMIYLTEGQYGTAETLLQKELQLQTSDTAWLQLGRLYYAQERYKEALNAWQNAYKINPYNLPTNTNLALVNAKLGNYTDARHYYLRAVSLGAMQTDEKKYLQILKEQYGLLMGIDNAN